MRLLSDESALTHTTNSGGVIRPLDDGRIFGWRAHTRVRPYSRLYYANAATDADNSAITSSGASENIAPCSMNCA